jgi:hypothetical protein
MTTPDIGSTAPAGGGDGAGSKVPGPALRPVEPSIPKKAKRKSIQVSPIVLDAARKGGEALLLQLRTAASGLTQAEADLRARTVGPNRWHKRSRKAGSSGSGRMATLLCYVGLTQLTPPRRQHRPARRLPSRLGSHNGTSITEGTAGCAVEDSGGRIIECRDLCMRYSRRRLRPTGR